MITAVVADFGGVLTNPLGQAFAAVQEQLGIDGDAIGAGMARYGAEAGVSPLEELECGRVSEREFMARLGEAVSAEVGREVPMHDFSERYWAALEVNRPLVDELARVRDEGYAMGLLTNNVREWEPRWRSMLPVDELFSVVVDSAFVGVRKPDAAIYSLVEQRLSVPGSEIVFLDDFAHNCEGARAAGWTAIHHEDTERTIAELRDVLASRGRPAGT